MSAKGEDKKQLSHIDQGGNARMVDVGYKKIQRRTAEASGVIRMGAGTLEAIREDQVKKGNVLAVAKVAGIQAAKASSSMIPMCHPLPLDSISIDFEFLSDGIQASCTVSCQARTGVEMEALTGVSLALLTIYDMCKAIDRGMILDHITLLKKQKEDISE